MNIAREVRSIPDTYRDLLEGRTYPVLSTVMPAGQPQSTVVWYDFGVHVLINTMRGFRKEKNMRANPQVTLLPYEPRNPLRSLEVRGEVEIIEERALGHVDELTRQYTQRRHYYGGIFPAERQAQEPRIICRIKPVKITLDAIHK
jgi:PPOX class probable F420-dependent enzyme